MFNILYIIFIQRDRNCFIRLKISFINNLPIENLKDIQLEEQNLPIEFRQVIAVFTQQDLPIEILSSIIVNNDIPIDIVGQTLAWVLDRRGVLWAIPERGSEWIRVAQSDTWKVNVQNDTWIIN